MVGIGFKTVNPWGTSRHCPRCGENGRTVKAPHNHTEQRHGGHFHCPECGYECDRDVVGPINVGRKHLSNTQMETANRVAYCEGVGFRLATAVKNARRRRRDPVRRTRVPP
jgi:transposase